LERRDNPASFLKLEAVNTSTKGHKMPTISMFYGILVLMFIEIIDNIIFRTFMSAIRGRKR
jgi:hypothetical protein